MRSMCRQGRSGAWRRRRSWNWPCVRRRAPAARCRRQVLFARERGHLAGVVDGRVEAVVVQITLDQMSHFFEHYKDLEPGKWVKIGGWHDAARARAMIVEAIERAKGK